MCFASFRSKLDFKLTRLEIVKIKIKNNYNNPLANLADEYCLYLLSDRLAVAMAIAMNRVGV